MIDEGEVIIRFGTKVRQLRKAKGYSQDRFAEEAGIDRSFYGQIERGENGAGLRVLFRIAKQLDIKLSELLDGVD